LAIEGDRRLLLGRIVGVYGVAGWVKLESHSEPRLRIFNYQPWLLKTAQAEHEVEGCHGRAQGKGIVAALPSVTNRDQAAALVGAEVWVWRSALPKIKNDEVYWTDLEGSEVVTTLGISLGHVSHIFATGANDVIVVRDAERERLIPFVSGQFVHDINLDMRRITVDWDPEF